MRILVTGAARAIGATTCRTLSDEGHEVVATARDPQMLEELDVAMRLALDVTDDESVRSALAAAGELDAIVNNGGEESQCGWCKDKWGISWQITPRVLTEAMAQGGEVARRAFTAMMPMKKIDVAAIQAAVRG